MMALECVSIEILFCVKTNTLIESYLILSPLKMQPLPYINSPFETLYKHFTLQARGGGKGKQNLCGKQDSWHEQTQIRHESKAMNRVRASFDMILNLQTWSGSKCSLKLTFLHPRHVWSDHPDHQGGSFHVSALSGSGDQIIEDVRDWKEKRYGTGMGAGDYSDAHDWSEAADSTSPGDRMSLEGFGCLSGAGC